MQNVPAFKSAQALVAVLLLLLGDADLAAKQSRQIRAEYTVAITDIQSQLIHVTAKFSNIDQPQLDLALPVWTPGWYTLEYYAKNVRQFTVTNGFGNRVPAPLVRAQTWRVETKGLTQIVVEFDYHATTLALNQAIVATDYAFFTGTQLFLEPVGHRSAPSTVRFALPAGWAIASALSETGDPAVYRAPNYDTLVDAPTWLGAFQSRRFEVEGKPYIVVFDSDARVAPDTLTAFMNSYLEIVRAQSRIFGGLPYDKYVSFHLPGKGDALEHMNSQVVMGRLSAENPPGVTQGHEHFHVWNVTRIRPAELWPHDYSRPVETPSLWMSEGVTDYYGALSAYRAGAITGEALLQWLANAIGNRESNSERGYISPSDASLTTWRGYLSEPVSYYNAGAVLGALLDLSIQHDTRGAKGLDDVMRALFRNFNSQNRGFTPADLQQTVSAVAGRDYKDFFRRYVNGIDVPPYEAILAAAGLRGTSQTQTRALLRTQTERVPGGQRFTSIVANGPAARAGLQVGDVVVAADGEPMPKHVPFLDEWLAPRAGGRTVLSVVRNGATIEVPVDLESRRRVQYRIEVDLNPTAAQLAVREGWLAKK